MFDFFKKWLTTPFLHQFARKLQAMQRRNRNAFGELAHIKATPVLDLYGDSRDRMNAVHEVHGGLHYMT